MHIVVTWVHYKLMLFSVLPLPRLSLLLHLFQHPLPPLLTSSMVLAICKRWILAADLTTIYLHNDFVSKWGILCAPSVVPAVPHVGYVSKWEILRAPFTVSLLNRVRLVSVSKWEIQRAPSTFRRASCPPHLSGCHLLAVVLFYHGCLAISWMQAFEWQQGTPRVGACTRQPIGFWRHSALANITNNTLICCCLAMDQHPMVHVTDPN